LNLRNIIRKLHNIRNSI